MSARIFGVAFGLIILLASSSIPLAQSPTPESAPRPIRAKVAIGDEASELELLYRMGIDVDAVFRGFARVYVTAEQLDKLRANGLKLDVVEDGAAAFAAQVQRDALTRVEAERGTVPAQYHTYATLTADLQQIAADHPDITRLISVGQSTQGRELWFMKISRNPDVDENEPEFAYISSMHGDEVVGKELCYNLIDYLTDNYPTDPRVAALIDNTEIWIMPSMNPDGSELVQRWNARGVDLNRNFPDQFVDDVNTTDGREPETAAIMNWRPLHSIDLTANYHGGALVVNYPYDSNPQGASVFSPAPSPDHQTYVSISRTYADPNGPLAQSNSHPAWDNGITNGADWYSVNGGMQDWEHVYHGGHEVLIEVSSTKFPPASELPQFWDDNLESMLAYMERVQEGIRGVVTDADTGLPLTATVRVNSNPLVDYTDPDVGDYHRLLPPGTYTLTFSADGYADVTVPNVIVNGGSATVTDVAMGPQPTNLQVDAYEILDVDGIVMPGEVVDLALTLRNYGRAANGVAGRLIPAGFDAEVTRDMATYADVALGETGDSEAPHHAIAADFGAPAGRKAGFAIEWETTEGRGTSEPFFISLGATSTGSSSATDVPAEITFQANVTIESVIDVPAQEAIDNITSLTVAVDITHSYIGDLEIDLISPDGTTVRLHDHTGGATDDIIGTYGVDLTSAESLAAFNGEGSLGSWTLRVTDTEFVDGGFLNGWTLNTEGRPADIGTPEVLFRDAVAEGVKATFRWWRHPDVQAYRIYRATTPSQSANFTDVTFQDADTTDAVFEDLTDAPILYYLVTGVGPNGEGPKGHFGE